MAILSDAGYKNMERGGKKKEKKKQKDKEGSG